MAFLTGRIWKKEDFFLKSSSRGFIFPYQFSNNNLQKDNFHNLIFGIDKMVGLGILSSKIRIDDSLSYRG